MQPLHFQEMIMGSDALRIASSLLLTYLLGQIIAFTYEKTFQGLSYSRSMIQAMILGSLVVAMAMHAIGDNLARGLGMMGALAIVRFRTSMRDPKDIIFIFACFAVGISCGVGAYAVAIIGTLMFCLAAFSMAKAPLGGDQLFDGVLRFNLPDDNAVRQQIQSILDQFCKRSILITVKEMAQGQRFEHSYQIKLKQKNSKGHLIQALKSCGDIRDSRLLLQEATIEV